MRRCQSSKWLPRHIEFKSWSNHRRINHLGLFLLEISEMKWNLIQSNINTNNNNNKKEVKSSSLEEKGDRKWQPVSARLTTDSIPQPDSRYNVTLGCGRNYLHIISPFFLFFSFEIHFPIRWEKYSNIQIHPNSSKFIQKKRKMSFLFPSFDPGVRMLSIFISGHVASQFAYKDPEIGVGVGVVVSGGRARWRHGRIAIKSIKSYWFKVPAPSVGFGSANQSIFYYN